MSILIENDDIRYYQQDYDPNMWNKLKEKNKVIKEKAVKRDKIIKQKIEKTIKEKPDRKQYKRENYEKNKLKMQEKQKKYYQGRGREWYLENKERLKEMRKKRDAINKPIISDEKYLYNRLYYQKNRDVINAKRRAKTKEKRIEKNITKESIYHKNYYEKNREYKIEKAKESYQRNKNKNIE
jgi:hypothetical protein